MMGIYKIENTINGNLYIGSCSNFNVRKGSHLCLLRQNKHHSIKLQRAYNKYGEISFIIILIEECEKENLLPREQFYIDTLLPKYNICPTAGSNLNRVFTKQHKENLSKSLKGKVRTLVQKEHQKQVKLGTTHSNETKNKISQIVNNMKGGRANDKINSVQILKFIEIANLENTIKTIKQICNENNFNYRSVLKFVSNQTWKEHFALLHQETISNFRNSSLTKKKHYGL